MPTTTRQTVPTRAIQAAIQGRESDVLDALGIAWRKGRPHVRCPYPDHDDQDPSWRWDGKKARAFCTCIERTDGILDVVMKVRSLNFDAAKVFVAEAIGRSDLIKGQDMPRERAPRMDAASLLKPPRDRLCHSLVSFYLAHRLGLAPDQAPVIPTTPIAGWTALPYYDPPVAEGGQPVHVGDYPCAVFSTIAFDGRRHAHRIYLAPGGAGKAELPDGRDPKKSAKLPKGKTASGCAVVWGDPAAAPHLIVAEGIETAAALAFVYAGAIAAGEIAIVATLSTAGMKAFRPWPATRTLTIAADRDEGPKGRMQGEKAARGLALAVYKNLDAVAIALPGGQGEKIDFLDELRRDGADAVRAALDIAKAYVPAAEELEGTRAATAARPSPASVSLPDDSEIAMALAFADMHQRDLRYVYPWQRWYVWNGTVWRPDETGAVPAMVRDSVHQVAAMAANAKSASDLAMNRTVRSVEQLARIDQRLAATVDQWDGNDWLMNTPGGIIDLRTSEMHPHYPEFYATKCTAVAADLKCPTPVWSEFLDTVTHGRRELAEFLQRMAGYALTGITREHALFFLHGLGGNGKSVFVSTLAGIMAAYHSTAAVESFISSSRERHPADLAALHGARLVTAVETEEGRRWNEPLIKSLTGGDRITARQLYRDFFTFTPRFKLVIAGNHKPGLRSVDNAIRRRFHLVPFTATIPEAERDDTLPERLRAEWPGILQWAVDGTVSWLEQGLAPPEAVTGATGAYMSSEDTLQNWISECCEPNARPDDWTQTSTLYTSFKAWADRTGEFAGSMKRLSQKLDDRGFRREQRRVGNGFLGLRLRPDMAVPPRAQHHTAYSD